MLNIHYPPEMVDDVKRGVEAALDSVSEVNISQMAHDMRLRYAKHNIALEDVVALVISVATRLQATVFFDGKERAPNDMPVVFDPFVQKVVARKIRAAA
jgi:hypothetical protein